MELGPYYLSQWENLKLCWFPYLVLVKKFELFIPWWLENRVYEMPKTQQSGTETEAATAAGACASTASGVKAGSWLLTRIVNIILLAS